MRRYTESTGGRWAISLGLCGKIVVLQEPGNSGEIGSSLSLAAQRTNALKLCQGSSLGWE